MKAKIAALVENLSDSIGEQELLRILSEFHHKIDKLHHDPRELCVVYCEMDGDTRDTDVLEPK